MYPYLLTFHSLFRWLVLISLLCSIGIGWTGLTARRHFSAIANAFRHWTATIAHIQLVLGVTLYFQSPIVRYPVPRDPDHIVDQHTFFRYIHSAGMFLAINPVQPMPMLQSRLIQTSQRNNEWKVNKYGYILAGMFNVKKKDYS